MRPRAAVLTLAAFCLVAGAAFAAGTPPNERPGGENGKSGKSLSEKLDKGKGVIRPAPGVDPNIVRPAPELPPQSMPVIPPPAPQAK
ncbi:hypothetical protein WOC76_03100 [Methylocystis sp. IM3]|uniref:hypothetical protein n=1 Tax=unclassified Methylocystis TaxID=2625913 RepID=UPI000F9DA7DE|nr:MAG: hypothetical protein EKK29_16870 [Hyphomicrobiales bacterium]